MRKQPRDYQRRSIDQLYAWFETGNEGDPCNVIPTGGGKSLVIAFLITEALQQWPDTRVLMLTHVKEILTQNLEALRDVWPGAPVGVYSSSLRKKQLGEPITFGGIQSLRTKAMMLGHIDLCIIDECHLVSHRDEGGYRTLIAALREINPHMRVVGYTATPWRLGHGLITEGDALFADLLESVSIEELISLGHLAPLRSKSTAARLDVSGVKKRGGEYIEAQLQAAVDKADVNAAVVDEIIARAGDRRHWLLFCTGVAHAQNIADCLSQRGITAACVHGGTPDGERDRILSAYKRGEIQAVTNANVLTTGFNFPNIDLLAFIRPTESPVLYVQMAGRGMRPKSHTDHCLVLDFAGLVRRHGPVTHVEPPKRRGGKGDGDAPVKACDECGELVHLSARECPACGWKFPEPKKVEQVTPFSDDIMGLDGVEMAVTSWQWRVHTSRASGMKMLTVSYYGELSDPVVSEYVTVLHQGYAQQKAMALLATCVRSAGVRSMPDISEETLQEACVALQAGRPPSEIKYKRDGKFFRVLERRWDGHQELAQVADRPLQDGTKLATAALSHVQPFQGR